MQDLQQTPFVIVATAARTGLDSHAEASDPVSLMQTASTAFRADRMDLLMIRDSFLIIRRRMILIGSSVDMEVLIL